MKISNGTGDHRELRVLLPVDIILGRGLARLRIEAFRPLWTMERTFHVQAATGWQ